MNYNEDPDDDGQAIRDQRIEDRILDREEEEEEERKRVSRNGENDEHGRG